MILCNKNIATTFALGISLLVTLYSYAQPINDNRADAVILSDLNQWCSGFFEYNNNGATQDVTTGSCWQNTASNGFNNVWFKFQATTPDITIEIHTELATGSMWAQQMALLDANNNEIACRIAPDWYYGKLSISQTGLTPGDWYYIMVDSRRADGKFTICINDKLDNDHFNTADTLSDIQGWCSTNIFTNLSATADQTPGACWEDNGGTGTKNVWFIFQATTIYANINIITTTSSVGNLRSQQFTLYDSSLNELECVATPDYYYGEAEMTYKGLTPGDWYYIAVDSRRTDGYFEICMDDQPTFDCIDGAIIIPSLGNYCSGMTSYTNLVATSDQTPGTCWQDNGGTGNSNVWFTFQATTQTISIDVITQNAPWNMRGQQYALYDASLNQLECMLPPDYYYGSAEMTYFGLTIGDWYYIAVDSRRDNGYFEICLDDQPGFDYKEGAIVIPNISNYCSGMTSYTNLVATADQSPGTCWQDNGGTGTNNVWFTFQAISQIISIDVITQSGAWNMRGQQFSIYDASLNELECMLPPDYYYGNAEMTYFGLTPGDWYFIAVDSRRDNGYFELCLDDQPGFDYKEGAIVIPNISNYCSGMNSYTNLVATADQSAGTCWQDNGGSGNDNVWFKFQASTQIVSIDIFTENGPWNMRGQQFALYDNSLNELECMLPPDYYFGSTEMTYFGLSAGDWYYIAVDSRRDNGYFEICLDDEPGFDYIEGAVDLTNYSNYCSGMTYTNLTATTDQSPGSCWADDGGTGTKNVWFKFQASSHSAIIDVFTENGNWAMRGQQYTLYDAALAEIQCVTTPDYHFGNAEMSTCDLTVGNWYYIAVDSRRDDGYFEICFNQPPILYPSFAIDTASCDSSVGKIEATINGGSPPYNYSWNNSAGSLTLTSLPEGEFIITVTDSLNCETIDTAVVPGTPKVIASGSSTDATCGSFNGSVTATPTSGGGVYYYDWGAAGIGQTVNGLAPGSYSVTITDTNACSTVATTSLINIGTIPTLSGTTTNVSCKGSSDGEIDLTATAGLSTLSYNWSNSQSTEDINSLSSGNYSVTVYDSTGCSASLSFNITEPPATISSVFTADTAKCGNPIGAVSCNASGGTPPFTYQWNNGSTSASLTNIAEGEYIVTITDSMNCIGIDTTDIPGTPAITATSSSTSANCGVADGTAAVTPTNGGGGYTFDWGSAAAGQTTSAVTGLSAGVYHVTINDNNLCSAVITTTVTNVGITPVVTGTSTNNNCYGYAEGEINITATGPTVLSYLWSNGATTEDLDSLSSGIYTVTVADSANCISTLTTVISDPSPISSSGFTTTSANCGVTTGSITTNISGGTPPYNYHWNTGDTTLQLSNLTAGEYIVTTTDLLSCSRVDTISVSGTPAVTASLSTSNPTCDSVNGTITATTLSGGGSYSYNWGAPVGGQTSPTVTGLSDGSFDLTITDANSCSTIVSTSLINVGTVPTISGITSNPTCNGFSDGEINITETSGITGLTYEWSNGQTSEDLSGLGPGTYIITVSDSTGCSNSLSLIISDPLPISNSGFVVDSSFCGLANASITTTINGGTPPYTYNWDNGDTSLNLNGLTAGYYVLTATDSLGCARIDTVNIPGTPAINAISTSTNANCGASDGTATVSPSSGGGSYSYQWGSLAGNQTTSTATGLSAGVYPVTITDANACTTVVSTTVINAGIIPTVSGVHTNVTCNGFADGTIDITATGSNTLTYLWNNGQSTPDLDSLSGGTYTISVTDSVNCFSTYTVVINEPPAISSSGLVIDTASCDLPTGSITTSFSGGTPPFNYIWSNGATSAVAINLTSGEHILTVTDSLNCARIDTFTVPGTPAINAISTTTDASCGVPDGTATVSPSSGGGSYSFEWGSLAGNQTSSTATGLSAGVYPVTITDANACTTVVSTTVINAGIIPTVSGVHTNVTCNGFADGTIDITATGSNTLTYLWSNGQSTQDLNSLSGGTYTISVTDSLNCLSTYTIVVNEPSTISNSGLTIDTASCDLPTGNINTSFSGGTPPYNYLWSNGTSSPSASNLASGVHILTITDSLNCSRIDTFNVPGTPAVIATSSSTNSTCGMANGTATATPISGAGLYFYDWGAAGAGQTSQTATGLSNGSYSVTITDTNGCATVSHTNITNIGITPTINSIITHVTCFGYSDGEIDISASAGLSNLTFLWSNGEVTEDLDSIDGGVYTVTVSDSTGCINTLSSVVIEPLPLSVSSSVVNLLCAGDPTGAINLSISGGTGPFSFLWSNESSSQNLTGLMDTTYMVTITDSSSCITVHSATITSPPALDALGLVTPSSGGLNNGAIDITVLGGTSPYTYSWEGPNSYVSTLEDPTNLEAGSYKVTITDDNGCIHTTSFDIIPVGISKIDNFFTHQVFPNPNDGNFKIKFENSSSRFFIIELRNIIGQIVYREEVKVDNRLIKNISLQVNTGAYFLVISANGINQTHKIIIK